MDGNKIIANFISGNAADQADTATPGSVGININSGGGGSPVHDTVISQNVIEDEDVDIAVNTPAEVDVHLNNLLGGKIGVADAVPSTKQQYAKAISTRPRTIGDVLLAPAVRDARRPVEPIFASPPGLTSLYPDPPHSCDDQK